MSSNLFILKFNVVRRYILKDIEQTIFHIFNNEDNPEEYIKIHGNDIFIQIYIDNFKEQFNKYMKKNPSIEDKLRFAAKNIVYIIKTHIYLYSDDTYEIHAFIEKFVKKQLNDFSQWCIELEDEVCHIRWTC